MKYRTRNPKPTETLVEYDRRLRSTPKAKHGGLRELRADKMYFREETSTRRFFYWAKKF